MFEVCSCFQMYQPCWKYYCINKNWESHWPSLIPLWEVKPSAENEKQFKNKTDSFLSIHLHFCDNFKIFYFLHFYKFIFTLFKKLSPLSELNSSRYFIVSWWGNLFILDKGLFYISVGPQSWNCSHRKLKIWV